MTWGDYMLPIGAAAGVATMVSLAVMAERAKVGSDALACAIVFVSTAVCAIIFSLSRLDSALIAREKQEENIRQQEAAAYEQKQAIKKKAEELFVEHLKTTGMYDIWRYNKCGAVPEKFEKKAAEYVKNS